MPAALARELRMITKTPQRFVVFHAAVCADHSDLHIFGRCSPHRTGDSLWLIRLVEMYRHCSNFNVTSGCPSPTFPWQPLTQSNGNPLRAAGAGGRLRSRIG